MFFKTNSFLYWILVIILAELVVMLIYKLLKSQRELKKLLNQSNIRPLGNFNKTPFEEDITSTRPDDYMVSTPHPVTQKMVESLPRRFSRIKLISKGGMGYVFNGHDRLLKRNVAIKMIAPEIIKDKAYIKQFVNEARSVASLEHPSIIKIYDVGGGEFPYFVMEYLEGISIEDLINTRKKLIEAEVLNFGSKMADAFNFCHDKGVIHADIKPSNVIIMKNMKEIRVIDFGIAKMAHFISSSKTSEFPVGSPEYMAPEYLKERKSNFITDVYSFGIVLYKMISGAFPYDESDILARLNNDPLDVITLVPEINESLRSLIMKCIMRQPAQRFQAFEEICSSFSKLKI